MGSYFSKCCKIKKKRKKTEENGTIHQQPKQNTDSGKIVLNRGDTVHPEDVGLDVPSEDTRKHSDVNSDKKNARVSSKKKRHKAETSSSDSSSSSSWSSSSADSSIRNRKKKKKRKKYGSNRTTVITKNIKVKGDMHKISNVENVTLNINHGPKQKARPRKVQKQNPLPENTTKAVNNAGSYKEHFTSYHTPETLKQEIQSLKTDVINVPAGFFSATHTRMEDTHAMTKILSMAGSVCKVVYPGGFSTGFRVGVNKLVVTRHTEVVMLGEYRNLAKAHRYEHSQFSPLEREGVYAVFNHDSSNKDPVKFFFKPRVHFVDNETDIAILELKPNDQHDMPEPFEYISFPKSEFVFIGHSNGGKKNYENVKKVIHVHQNEATMREIRELRQWSLDKFRRPYDDEEYADCTSIHRHLFKSDMVNGCSGSPGLVLVDGKHVAVVTVYLHKCPDWLFDPDVPQSDKKAVPESYCVSQGANMFSLYGKLLSNYEDLCHEIFKPWPDT